MQIACIQSNFPWKKNLLKNRLPDTLGSVRHCTVTDGTIEFYYRQCSPFHDYRQTKSLRCDRLLKTEQHMRFKDLLTKISLNSQLSYQTSPLNFTAVINQIDNILL